MASGIYQIRNKVNEKRYVGSSVDIEWRQYEHLYNLRLGEHYNKYLQNAFNKYGEESFKFEIVEIIDNTKRLIKKEQYYIDKLSPEYNMCPIAGNCLGRKHSEKFKRKLSEFMKEWWTPERRQKRSKSFRGEKNPNYGKPMSEEQKRKISKAQLGKTLTEEHKRKLRVKSLGRKHTEEAKKKMSKYAQNRPEEFNRKIGEGLKKYWARRRLPLEEKIIEGKATA